MKEKRGKYWYGSVLNMVKHFSELKTDKSEEAQRYYKAIMDALRETEQTPDGKLKVKAIDLVLIKKTNTAQGAALKVYACERTVKGWISAFIYLVGRKIGY